MTPIQLPHRNAISAFVSSIPSRINLNNPTDFDPSSFHSFGRPQQSNNPPSVESGEAVPTDFPKYPVNPTANDDPVEACIGRCNSTSNLWWCSQCSRTSSVDIILCGRCWEGQLIHSHVSGTTHEKTELEIRKLINRLMPKASSECPTTSEVSLPVNTKWFGVRIKSFRANLEVTRRFNEISTALGDNIPSLVCFVGETGAGKSTLISALLEFDNRGSEIGSVEAPIIGSDATTPTSSDVHLFHGRSTSDPDRPLFYIDCEGMRGGNNPTTTEKIHPKSPIRPLHDYEIDYLSPDKCSKSWMVNNLYPRILFTFSDVVIYVTKESRSLEQILTQFIQWADAVYDCAVNQPSLPYAVIVINQVQDIHDTKLWRDDLTKDVLTKLAGCISINHDLKTLAETRRSPDRPVNTIGDLIHCYFSNIRIVSIPIMTESPALFQKQHQLLSRIISEETKLARINRLHAELLLNCEELALCLTYAFKHYSTNKSQPFNFATSAVKCRRPEPSFRSHVIQLARLMLDNLPTRLSRSAFNTDILAPLVASALLLDVCRNEYPDRSEAGVIVRYGIHFRAAMKEFWDNFWPCGYTDTEGGHCVNVKTKHLKGHQINSGKSVAGGNYRSGDGDSIRDICEQSVKSVSDEYTKLLQRLDQNAIRSSAAVIRAEILADQRYSKTWRPRPNVSLGAGNPDSETAVNHYTCFGCLFSVPVLALPCGHVLCDTCIQDFSLPDKQRQWVRTVKYCPLCGNNEKLYPAPPWTICNEPKQAAPRVLSLDGGGVRSIIELIILSEIEKRTGLDIPIRCFFDLIIGSSGGGIVALALSQMTAVKALKMFNEFSHQAFQKRFGADIPGFKYAVEWLYKGKYKTEPLIHSLKGSLGTGVMFGDPGDYTHGRRPVRVGVTMTNMSYKSYLVTNYNRSSKPTTDDAGGGMYSFYRPKNKACEMAIWEAARATSAAPRYFKPHYISDKEAEFMDGAINYSNPVYVADTESKLLWPDHQHPDIVLSIGTGYGQQHGDSHEDDEPKHPNYGRFVYKLLEYMFKQHISKQSQITWEGFLANQRVVKETKDERYHRLNVEFQTGKLPEPDGIEEMEYMETETTLYCKEHPDLITAISNKLISSLFYLKLDEIKQDHTDQHRQLCKGTILCRLNADSQGYDKICNVMNSHYNLSEPQIRVQIDNEEAQPINTTFRNTQSGNLAASITFFASSEKQIRIFLHSPYSEGYFRHRHNEDYFLISGFPCSMADLKLLNTEIQ